MNDDVVLLIKDLTSTVSRSTIFDELSFPPRLVGLPLSTVHHRYQKGV